MYRHGSDKLIKDIAREYNYDMGKITDDLIFDIWHICVEQSSDVKKLCDICLEEYYDMYYESLEREERRYQISAVVNGERIFYIDTAKNIDVMEYKVQEKYKGCDITDIDIEYFDVVL